MPALAEQLRIQYATLEWPQKRALANELNNLNRGKSVWWARRPGHAAHLAKLLDTDLDDLGLGARPPALTNLDFPGFPGMPPVDLRRDALWDLGDARLRDAEAESQPHLVSLEEWLVPSPWQWQPPYEWHWLCIDDELERHALARRLEITGRWDIVRADTLESVADRLAQAAPLIVVVRIVQPENDVAALAARPAGAGLLVVAPTLLPPRTAAASPLEDYGWEHLGLSPAQRADFDLSGRNAVRRWTWERPPRWRTAFLQWIERHFLRTGRDSLYSATGMQGWLERFDPQEEWFSAPSDLLAICLGFESEKELPQRDDPQAGRRLAAVLDRSGPGFEWDAFDAICIARWKDMGTAWEGGLPLAAWQALVPAPSSAPSEEEWNAMLEGETLAERKASKAEWQQRRRTADPRWLTDSSFLVAKAGGHDFRHRAVAHLRIRDVLMADMQRDSTAEWAQACFDPPRCRLVDAALDALSMEELGALSDRLMQPDAIALESLGAAEAIFCALGRHIARQMANNDLRDFPGLADRFAPLVRQVVGRLDFAYADWALPAPWSRPVHTPAQQLDWITVCWAWSLVPMEDVPAGQWLFPGWSGDALLRAAPPWLSELWPAGKTTDLPRAWTLFFGVADAWVREVAQPQPEAPRLLHIAYLAEAGRGAWEVQSAWWEGIGSPGDLDWVDALLIARLDQTSAPQRLWKTYVSAEARTKDFMLLLWWRRDVRRWMLESAPPASLIEALDADGIRYLASIPHTLPPAMRGPLLLRFYALLPSAHVEFDPAWLDRFGPSAAEAVEQLLIADGARAWELGPALWTWRPERAAGLLSAPDDGSFAPYRSALVECCPAEHRHRVVDALGMRPDLLPPDELRHWVRAALPGSGALAARLVALLDSGPGADIPAQGMRRTAPVKSRPFLQASVRPRPRPGAPSRPDRPPP